MLPRCETSAYQHSLDSKFLQEKVAQGPQTLHIDGELLAAKSVTQICHKVPKQYHEFVLMGDIFLHSKCDESFYLLLTLIHNIE
jgi:hypothetical protein